MKSNIIQALVTIALGTWFIVARGMAARVLVNANKAIWKVELAPKPLEAIFLIAGILVLLRGILRLL